MLCISCAGTTGRRSHKGPSFNTGSIDFNYLTSIGPLIEGTKPLYKPLDIDFDVDGNIFICDNGNDRIVKLNPRFGFVREVGGFGVGNEQFSDPADIAFDNKLTLFVADSQQRKIKRFDRDLNFIDLFSEYKDESGSSSLIGKPGGIYISRPGDIYISDLDNDRVLILDSFYRLRAEVGGFGTGFGELSNPLGLTVDSSDRLYVADSDNHRISVYNSLGEFEGELGNDQLRSPSDVEIDKNGVIFVSDRITGAVHVYSPSGRYITDTAAADISFGEPAGIKLSPDGRLYVADSRRNQIVILTITRQN
jgi:DNA-binding beta-propeller fold protein YncE